MMELLLVGIGGTIGSLLRFELGRLIAERAKTTFPIGTFLINISGAIGLGIVMNLSLDRSLMLLFATGLLGAYTTFSTFMYEGFYLYQEKERGKAISYIGWSLLLGVIGYMIGGGVVNL